jgi:hypothetical protein
VSLEDDLDRAIAMAQGMASADERLAAVMPAESEPGQIVFLTAFEGADELSYAVLAMDGSVLTDRRAVGDVVTVLALAERAEELSAATEADGLQLAFGDLETTLRSVDAEAADAAAGVVAAAAETAQIAAGPRAATPAYLDRVAHVAEAMAVALDAFEQQAERLAAAAATDPAMADPAAAAWQAMALAARSGDPAGLAQAMTAGAGSMEALVEDVLEHYRVALT